MPRSGSRSLIPIPDNVEEPFDLSNFYFYMKCTVCRLCKVLGMDGSSTVPIELLMMVMNIQHPYFNTDYDYVGYLVQHIHDAFVDIQKNASVINVKHYSILMHLIL